jgi:hypothetical protein
MLSSLPNLAPRDFHALWQSTSQNNSSTTDSTNPNASDPQSTTIPGTQTLPSATDRRTLALATLRSPLSRLRADELYLSRRRQNVSDYGSGWIKPPGISKTLHQRREDERETREHAEAMRREQLAMELAEAEAAQGMVGLQGIGLGGEGAEGDVDGGMGVDMDEAIPEAEGLGVDFDASRNDLDEEASQPDEDTRGGGGQRILGESFYREQLLRSGGHHGSGFGNGDLDSDEEDNSQLLQEEDLVHENDMDNDLGMDINMDTDLDGSVPEVDVGGYEHTDTEDELSDMSDSSD